LHLKPSYACVPNVTPKVTLVDYQGGFKKEGRFGKETVWKGLVPGPYTLTVQGQGWKTSVYGLELPDTAPVQDLEITPEPWRTISGKVVAAADGQPIPVFGIRVDYRVRSVSGVSTGFLLAGSTRFRNTKGIFCLEGAVPAPGKATEFRVGAEAEGFPRVNTAWIPNDSANSTNGLILRLVKTAYAYAWVEGQVVRKDGTPVSGAWCAILPPGHRSPWVEGGRLVEDFLSPEKEERKFASVKSAEDGRFELGVRDPGDYRVVVIPPDKDQAPAQLPISDIRVGEHSGPYQIVLGAGAILEVSVVLPPSEDPPVHLQGISLYGPGTNSDDFEDKFVPIQGIHATVEGLVAGKWTINLDGWQGNKLVPKPGTVITPVLASQKVRIRPGEKQEIVFDLASEGVGMVLEGRLLLPSDWKDINFIVNVHSGEEPFSSLKSGGTDEEGRFVLRGIPDRKILVLGGGFSQGMDRIAVAARLLESPQSASGLLTLDATMPRVHGQAWKDGKPAANVSLAFQLESGKGESASLVDKFLAENLFVETNAQGHFEIAGLPTGLYSIFDRMADEGAEDLASFEIRSRRDVVDLRVDM